MTAIEKWTAHELAEALVKRYCDGTTTANMFEFEMPTDEDGKFNRRADLLTIFCSGCSDQHPFVVDRQEERHHQIMMKRIPWGWRVGFELKVSRADFKVDVKQQWKHTPIQRVVNEFYFVTPRALIDWQNKDHHLLPGGAGLIECWRDPRGRWRGALRARITSLARVNFHPETTVHFVDAIVRRSLYGQVTSGLEAVRRRGRRSFNPMEIVS